MAMYYNGKKVRNLYFNGKCITRLALGKEMTRLVEGDDFVRAEWLVGDGTAYIDTGIIVPNEVVLVATRLICNSNTYSTNYSCAPFSNRIGAQNNPMVCITQRKDNSEVYNDIENPRVPIHYNIGNVIPVTSVTNTAQNGEGTLKLYYTDDMSFKVVPWDGKISNFEVESLESDFNISLTPCRLLRPIPAALDANGIARNADECGMYDSVSGKFYGNVASSGSFTVSDN